MTEAMQVRIGEIIETETTLFVAESFELHRPPPLGSLVCVQGDDGTHFYGLVCHGTTASPDPGRRAVRRSTDDVYNQAIYNAHPQLRLTLRTEFTARLIGYAQTGSIHHYLPPQPPALHYLVYACSPDQVRRITDQLAYLRLLLNATEIAPEQLLAAHIREVYRMRDCNTDWLAKAAREVAGLLKNDYERLMTVLYGIEPQQ